MNKRTIQEIFDAVIDAKHYPYKRGYYYSSNFMCDALKYAKLEDTITEEEMQRALKSIKSYINELFPELAPHNPALRSVWKCAGIMSWELGFDREQIKLLACYKDWTNRPYLHRKLKKL